MSQKILKIFSILLVVFTLFSCTKESIDLNNLNETIIIRHKNADMPAYVHGNASEKVFLILLHGGPGGTGLQYRLNTIKNQLEENNVVVYFDQRGSGNSQGNYSESDVSVDLMAEDVLALTKVLKAKYGSESRFFLMGHSWGGTLGPATLLKDQSDFMGWINVDGSHDPKGVYDRYRNNFTNVANEQIALENSVSYWNNVLSLVQNVSSDYNDDDFFKMNRESNKAHEILTQDLGLNQENTDVDNGFTYNFFTISWNTTKIQSILIEKGLFKDVSYTNQLSNITIPSLILWGKHDMNVPLSYAYEAYNNLGSNDKELVIFEKSTHSPMFSEPNLFANKVIDFINQHK